MIKRAVRKAQNVDGGSSRQGFATPRTALSITTRRERGENSATLRCTPGSGRGLTVVARLDWHCFHRVRNPENSINRPLSMFISWTLSLNQLRAPVTGHILQKGTSDGTNKKKGDKT